VVDLSRSRVLARAARKYNSQALEADALHFSTDVWSSLVVILGLIGVRLSDALPRLNWLGQADAVAAFGVALIVIVLSLRLGKRTVEALLDTAPGGHAESIRKAVETVPGIGDCHSVRIRTSGPFVFVDVHVTMDGQQSLHDAHRLTEGVEHAIRSILPGADVTVHPEPHEAELPAGSEASPFPDRLGTRRVHREEP
jgi:cation diffusion facilitator family transporter